MDFASKDEYELSSFDSLTVFHGLHINSFHIKPHRTLAPVHAVLFLCAQEEHHVEHLHLDNLMLHCLI